jgi:catechol 2,3-dioxygenase-like lactoylglutathione lyase family enzyme
MAKFTHDHVHLRSPDPEATAQFYERMFGAEVLRTVQQGKPRVDLDLCGLKVFRRTGTTRPGVRLNSPAARNATLSIWRNGPCPATKP